MALKTREVYHPDGQTKCRLTGEDALKRNRLDDASNGPTKGTDVSLCRDVETHLKHRRLSEFAFINLDNYSIKFFLLKDVRHSTYGEFEKINVRFIALFILIQQRFFNLYATIDFEDPVF